MNAAQLPVIASRGAPAVSLLIADPASLVNVDTFWDAFAETGIEDGTLNAELSPAVGGVRPITNSAVGAAESYRFYTDASRTFPGVSNLPSSGPTLGRSQDDEYHNYDFITVIEAPGVSYASVTEPGVFNRGGFTRIGHNGATVAGGQSGVFYRFRGGNRVQFDTPLANQNPGPYIFHYRQYFGNEPDDPGRIDVYLNGQFAASMAGIWFAYDYIRLYQHFASVHYSLIALSTGGFNSFGEPVEGGRTGHFSAPDLALIYGHIQARTGLGPGLSFAL